MLIRQGLNKTFFIIFNVMLLSSCSIMTPDPYISEFKGVRIYSSTAELQSAFMKDHDSQEHFCAARESDVADTSSQGIGLTASAADAGEGISEGASRGALDLGGRSPAVLISREVLYRTCELMMNLNLSKADALELYKQTINAVITISQSDTSAGGVAFAADAPKVSVDDHSLSKVSVDDHSPSTAQSSASDDYTLDDSDEYDSDEDEDETVDDNPNN